MVEKKAHEGYLSVDEIAKDFGVNAIKVYQLIKKIGLKATRYEFDKRKRFYSPEQIEQIRQRLLQPSEE